MAFSRMWSSLFPGAETANGKQQEFCFGRALFFQFPAAKDEVNDKLLNYPVHSNT